MDKKIKECLSPHALMHTLTGLGLGLLVAALVPSLAVWWIGAAVVAVAVVLEMTRK